MHKHLYIVLIILYTALLFPSCRLKKGAVAEKGYIVGDFDKQLLCGEVIADMESTDNSLARRETLGLWWQNDSLRITINQGRQLSAVRVKGDTLYLHEAPRDTMDMNTRQYVIHILQQELLIIKYNDSLVYPLMPISAKCEYPLDIKSLLTVQQQAPQKKETQEQATQNKQKGSASNSYPDSDEKRITGTFYWGHYIDPSSQKMQLDTTHAMKNTEDGIWKEYRNDTLVNCGIIRRHQKVKGYVMYVDAPYLVLMTDTTEISGHIHPVGDMWPYLRNGGRLPEGEYFFDGRYYMTEFRLYPSRVVEYPHFESLITLGSILICNGETYGWVQKSKYHTYK